MKNTDTDLFECLVKSNEKLEACQTLLVSVYQNVNHPIAKALIEALAEEQKGDFKYNLDLVK